MESPLPASTESPTEISIVGGEAFVWSAASIAHLRRTYGIVGLLTGSLPLIPQQNAFLGVPLQLFEEEVVYLMRRRAVVLVEDVKANSVDGMEGEQLDQWHEQRVASIMHKRRAAVEEARESRERYKRQFAMSDAARDRKKEREERKKQDAESTEQAATLFQPERQPREEGDAESTSHLITIPAASTNLPWHSVRLGVNAFDSLSSAAKAGLWRYPANADERARCATFEALKEKGYYLGKGLRFGGDFVVYPGDPLRYHSHFTATVQTTPQSPVSAHELIAAGRLGTAVKKAHLLCSVTLSGDEEGGWERRLSGGEDGGDEGWGSVDFISLTWAGFGV